MKDIEEIVEKYEVPKEYFDALWDAYEAGAKRGYIKAGIAAITPPQQLKAKKDSV